MSLACYDKHFEIKTKIFNKHLFCIVSTEKLFTLIKLAVLMPKL